MNSFVSWNNFQVHHSVAIVFNTPKYYSDQLNHLEFISHVSSDLTALSL